MTEPIEGLIIPHWKTLISGNVQSVLVKVMTILLDFPVTLHFKKEKLSTNSSKTSIVF